MSSEKEILTGRMRNGGVLTRNAKGYDCRHGPYARVSPPHFLPAQDGTEMWNTSSGSIEDPGKLESEDEL